METIPELEKDYSRSTSSTSVLHDDEGLTTRYDSGYLAIQDELPPDQRALQATMHHENGAYAAVDHESDTHIYAKGNLSTHKEEAKIVLPAGSLHIHGEGILTADRTTSPEFGTVQLPPNTVDFTKGADVFMSVAVDFDGEDESFEDISQEGVAGPWDDGYREEIGREERGNLVGDLLCSLEDMPEGHVNPVSNAGFEPVAFPLHHLNFNSTYVFERSSTSPEISLWAIVSTANRPFTHLPSFTRRSVLAAQAARWVDPVYYTGPAENLRLTGTKLREAVTGQVTKCYAPVGTWYLDHVGMDDDIAYGFYPGTACWNSTNAPVLTMPYIIRDEDHHQPNFNGTTEVIKPLRPSGWGPHGPSPLRNCIYQLSDDAGTDDNVTTTLESSDAGHFDTDEDADLEDDAFGRLDSAVTKEIGSGGEGIEWFDTSAEDSSNTRSPSDSNSLDNQRCRSQTPDSEPGSVELEVPTDDLEHTDLPDPKGCDVAGMSQATRSLVALVETLKRDYCGNSRASEPSQVQDTYAVCGPQTLSEVELDTTYMYGDMSEDPRAPEDELSVEVAKKSREGDETQKNESRPEEQISNGLQEQIDREGLELQDTQVSEETIKTEAPEGVESASIEKPTEQRKVTEEAQEARPTSEGIEASALGKWLCYGAAVAYVGFYVYRRLRR